MQAIFRAMKQMLKAVGAAQHLEAFGPESCPPNGARLAAARPSRDLIHTAQKVRQTLTTCQPSIAFSAPRDARRLMTHKNVPRPARRRPPAGC